MLVLSVGAVGGSDGNLSMFTEEVTDHDDFITNDFHLWPSEVLQCNNRR